MLAVVRSAERLSIPVDLVPDLGQRNERLHRPIHKGILNTSIGFSEAGTQVGGNVYRAIAPDDGFQIRSLVSSHFTSLHLTSPVSTAVLNSTTPNEHLRKSRRYTDGRQDVPYKRQEVVNVRYP